MSDEKRRIYKFGPFRLDTGKAVLMKNDLPVRLEPMEFDALVLLIQRKGELVKKSEFTKKLWPDAFVEEGRVHNIISNLRGELGDDTSNPLYIKTVTRRGYRFIAELDEVSDGDENRGQNLNQAPQTTSVTNSFDEASVTPVLRLPYVADNSTVHRRHWIIWLVLSVAVLVILLLVGSRTFKKPKISAIFPERPLATIGDQSVMVYGENFQTGMTVKVMFPEIGSAILSGSQIRNLTSTSFVMVIDFNGNPGIYALQANNPYGRSSDPYTFKAESFIKKPIIEAIVPEIPIATKDEQPIIIYGRNFQFNADVEIILPDGRVVTLGRDKISNTTHTNIRALIYFDGRPGEYGVRVKNPNEIRSDPFAFTVQ